MYSIIKILLYFLGRGEGLTECMVIMSIKPYCKISYPWIRGISPCVGPIWPRSKNLYIFYYSTFTVVEDKSNA